MCFEGEGLEMSSVSFHKIITVSIFSVHETFNVYKIEYRVVLLKCQATKKNGFVSRDDE